MKFLDAATNLQGRSSTELMNALDQIMRGEWWLCEQEIADHIAALTKDQRLLREWVSAAATADDLPLMQGAQSFLVFQSPHTYVRINLWLPRGRAGERYDSYRRYLSIQELHNHDFDFFTARLFGPGYRSRFYEGPVPEQPYSPGDVVSLIDKGEIALDADRIMFVSRDKDYHSQEWVDSFSVTMNVIPRSTSGGVQYLIDDKDMSVRFVIDNRHRMPTELRQ